MSALVIEVRGVTKAFGGVVANDNVSLSVANGSITGLIGPNGSGKTTLFNSIVGHHPIDAGSIRFLGREISRLNVQHVITSYSIHYTKLYESMPQLSSSFSERLKTWLTW